MFRGRFFLPLKYIVLPHFIFQTVDDGDSEDDHWANELQTQVTWQVEFWPV